MNQNLSVLLSFNTIQSTDLLLKEYFNGKRQCNTGNGTRNIYTDTIRGRKTEIEKERTFKEYADRQRVQHQRTMCHQSHDDQNRYHQYFSVDEIWEKFYPDENRAAQKL